MNGVVEDIIRECGEEPPPQGFPRIPLLKMDCLSKYLVKESEERERNPLAVIAFLQSLKIRLREYIGIAESDENLIALKEKLREEYGDNYHQFNAYFREIVGECKECWDGCTDDNHQAVKVYLATILLIHAADALLNTSVPQRDRTHIELLRGVLEMYIRELIRIVLETDIS